MQDSHTLEWKGRDGSINFYSGFVSPPSTYNYKFAILHLIQGLELLIKAYIHSKDPDAIYRNKKKKNTTISLREGKIKLLDLEPNLLNDQQIKLIEQANDIRNAIEHYEFSYATKDARNIALEFLSISNYLVYKLFNINLAEEFSYNPWTDDYDPVGGILESLFYEMGIAGRNSADSLASIWKERNLDDTLYVCLQCGARGASVVKGYCIVCTSPTEEKIGEVLTELEDLQEVYVRLS